MVNDTAPADLDSETVEPADPGRKRAITLIGGAGLLALLLRLPFLFTGLSTDEGGYAYVAQQWSRGAKLYGTELAGTGPTGTAWLDRPQGLLLTYRALLWINDSGWTIRLGMMLAGAVITICLGVIGWQLAGRNAGVAAALLYAVIGVAPHLEGMTLNGELLASVPATASIAAILLWRRALRRCDLPGRGRWSRGWPAWWLIAAGLLAGVAMTMKQSGIDGVLVGLAVVLVAGGRRLRRALTFLTAFAVPIAACVIQGWSLGLSTYWTALAGYQFNAIGGAAANSASRLHDFDRFLGAISIDLVGVLIVAAFAFRVLSRFGRVVAITWLAAGFIGVNLGGSYWPHYYMQPLTPLVLLAAVALTSPITGVRAIKGVRVTVAALLVLPTLIWMIALIPMSTHHRQKTIPYFALAQRDRDLARFIDAQTTPDQRIYVVESAAYLYFLAQRPAGYPYLWGMPIQKIPTAVPLLRTMLESPDRPTLVIMDQPDPGTVDPSGGVGDDLATYYHPDTVIDGVQILRAN
jgi:4-amino-4-deoxy-L-arabinose transferase-like glycosyltransferase